MAAVDGVTASDLGPGLGGFGTALEEVKDRLLDQVKAQGWRWFHANAGRVLYAKRVVFWTITVRVADLRFIFEDLFGREPAA
jgi:hypothetical protein